MFHRRYYLIAPNFHGATLLGKLLNAHPDVVSLGDTYPSNRFDQTCGCGALVSRCPFWNKVRTDTDAARFSAYPHMLPDYPELVNPIADKFIYNLLAPQKLSAHLSDGDTFMDDYARFLTSVHEQNPGDVFVDGLKSISRVLALVALAAPVDGVIHIYRRPGDYGKSAQRNFGDGSRSWAKHLLAWRVFHRQAQRLQKYVPYLTVRYEDLASTTDQTLARLFDFMALPPMDLEALRPRLAAPWHFMGNASLLDFDGKISPRQYSLSRREETWERWLTGFAPNKPPHG